MAQQKQADLVSFRVAWSQAVLFGCYEVSDVSAAFRILNIQCLMPPCSIQGYCQLLLGGGQHVLLQEARGGCEDNVWDIIS